MNQAFRHYYVAEYETALQEAGEALDTFEEIGDLVGVGNVLAGFGQLNWSLGDYEAALDALHRSVAIFREVGSDRRRAWSLNAMGGVYEATETWTSPWTVTEKASSSSRTTVTSWVWDEL